MTETRTTTLRDRLWFWGKIVVAIGIVWVALVIWNPGTLFRAGNPVPEIDEAVIHHHQMGDIKVPAKDIAVLHKLFDISRGDPFNSTKWKESYRIEATLKSGEKLRIGVFSTSPQYWAAYRLDGAGFKGSYFRGGTNAEFDAFLDKIAAAKGKSRVARKSE